MKKIIINLCVPFASLLLFNFSVSAQAPLPYTEGPVWQVQFVNMKPGMSDIYLKNLADGWIKEMRAAKDQGLIMDYKVLEAANAEENDWNLMLMYELKNYAMLDGMNQKMRAIGNKLLGSEEAQHSNAISRNDMRNLKGGRLTQELDYK